MDNIRTCDIPLSHVVREYVAVDYMIGQTVGYTGHINILPLSAVTAHNHGFSVNVGRDDISSKTFLSKIRNP